MGYQETNLEILSFLTIHLKRLVKNPLCPLLL